MSGSSKFRRLLKVLLVLLALAGVGLTIWLFRLGSSGLPRRSGEVTLSGLEASVTVRFDRWGVPRVEASSSRDLAAAVGYLHANDRFVQLEMGRRLASGRLSELFGGSLVATDQRMRRLRLRRTAEAAWDLVEPETRRWLEGYAAGVNAWLVERGDDLPPELAALGVEPEPWEPVDSLSFAGLMAHDLSFFQGVPEERYYVWLRELGEERLRDLLGPELFLPPEIAALAAEERGAAKSAAAVSERRQDSLGPAFERSVAFGSNSWAVDPTRTASGSSLLANDPHLALGLPNTWYEIQLRSPEYELAGMTLPGLPVVVIGQSRHLAWSLTHAVADDVDVFFERLDADGRRVRRADGWEEIRRQAETIGLRGGETVDFEILETSRGALFPADTEWGVPARSLTWTAFEPTDGLIDFLRLARTTTLEEVPAALGSYVVPAMNLVVASRDGLYFTVHGRIPERLQGDGVLPLPGWADGYGWNGLRPQDRNPAVTRPETGLLATANDDVVPPDYVLDFPADFDVPFRGERIRQILRQRTDWRAADFARVQTDAVSLYALRVVELLAGSYDGDAGRALATLRSWDGTMAARGPAALFALVERAVMDGIFEDEAVENGLFDLGGPARLVRLLAGGMDPAWFDDVSTSEAEDRHATVAAALASAWRDGVARWGEDPKAWDYGEAHPLRLEGSLGFLPVVGGWFNRGPWPVEGSATSVLAFAGFWRGGDRQWVSSGPGMRFIADLADPDRSLAGLLGGQSGHPRDSHYDDQAEPFLAGELHPVAWSAAAVEKTTETVLRLIPGGNGRLEISRQNQGRELSP